jgi:hypothetical protein
LAAKALASKKAAGLKKAAEERKSRFEPKANGQDGAASLRLFVKKAPWGSRMGFSKRALTRGL